MKRIYLCGPMSGIPDFNYPAFNAEAKRLRDLGYLVENPAENAAPICGTWAGWMRKALTQLLRCDTTATLPNWRPSRGARLEVFLSRILDMRVVRAERIRR